MGLILLVDDDPDFLAMHGAVLEREGHEVMTSTDPQKALTLMLRRKPHLVITDLMMKRLDSGFTLARQIREDPRLADVPVIVVTGVARRLGFDFRPRTDDDLAALHADGFFEKPIPPEILVARVAQLLAQSPEEERP